MFQYFPKNYVWSLPVTAALDAGGAIGEIDDMCRPLLEVALQGDDPGTEAFYHAWKGGADKLIGLAEEDEAAGRLLSAGTKYGRAATYLAIAERMQSQGFDGRLALYKQALDLYGKSRKLGRQNCERIEIPYEPAPISGLLVRAEGVERAPILVVMNGLDSTKEGFHRNPITQMLSQRGISVLFVDQPGTGEALRLNGMPAVYNSEVWASRIVDYLLTRPDVDPDRIGAMGISLGGYYCPRALAFEPRFALGAVWGANHNWGEVQHRRLKREGENPVPHYWSHVQWVWGAKDQDEFMATAEKVHLNGILDRIRVPFLVTHGSNDRQIPVEYAQQTYDQLVNSPKRELKIFSPREGGVEHSSIDNSHNAGAFIADWIAENLGGRTD